MDKEPKKAPLLKIQNLNNVKFKGVTIGIILC